MEQQPLHDAIEVRSKGYGVMVLLFLVLILIIAMCGVASFGYVAWNKLQVLEQKVESANFQTQTDLSKLGQLTESLNQKQQDLAINLNRLNVSHDKLIIYQVNQLVSMANQLLLVYGDVAGCIKLLSYTQNLLQVDNDNGTSGADFVELQQALGKDLEQLKQIKIVDRANIAGRLDSLIQIAQTLPNSTSYNAFTLQNNSSIKAPSSNMWQRFLTNFKLTLASLVKVSTRDGKFGRYLSQEQSVIVAQSLKLDLLDARVALIEGSQVQWVESLASSKNLIDTYFVVKAPAVTSFLNSLSELIGMYICFRQANINNTLDAVNKLNEKLN